MQIVKNTTILYEPLEEKASGSSTPASRAAHMKRHSKRELRLPFFCAITDQDSYY